MSTQTINVTITQPPTIKPQITGVGVKGDTGASIISAAFSNNDIVFTKDDASIVTLTDAAITLKGDTGETGPKGEKGDPGAGGVIPAGVENNIVTISADAEIQDSGKSIDDIINIIYPVGSIYISTVSTNPGTLFGVGTWTAFGAGRTLVGLDSGDSDFNTVEETGGEKTHTLSVTEMPSHNHEAGGLTQDPNYYAGWGSRSGWAVASTNADNGGQFHKDTGGGQAHNNLQPYIVTYMWKRVS